MTNAPVAEDTPSHRENRAVVRPSRWGYVAALALLLIGVAVFLAVVLQGQAQVREAVEGLQRVVLPSGGGGFTVDHPGLVTLYYEKRSVAPDPNDPRGGTAYETPMRWDGPVLAAQAFDVEGIERGTLIESEPWAGTGTETGTLVYHVPPYVGESVATLDLPAPGRYVLQGDGDWPGVDPMLAVYNHDAQRVIAIGHVPVELLKTGFRGIYGAAVLLGISFTVAVLLGLITWARRHPVRRPPADASA